MIEVITVYAYSSDLQTEDEDLESRLNELIGRIIQVEQIIPGTYRVILEV